MSVVLIELNDAVGWADTVNGKFPSMAELDGNLALSLQEVLIGQLSSTFNTALWVSPATTPSLIKKILGMQYTASAFERMYADDNDISNYGTRLLQQADKLIQGLIAGNITLTDLSDTDVVAAGIGQPAFFPTNASSAQEPTKDFPSFGGPAFTIGELW
jgi:hypothetical protein